MTGVLLLPNERDHEAVAEAVQSPEGPSVAISVSVGGEDATGMYLSGEWGQTGLAIEMDATFAGLLPRRLNGAPLELSVEVNGKEIPQLSAHRSLPKPDEGETQTTSLEAWSAGHLAPEWPLERGTEFSGVLPRVVARAVLSLLPYQDRGKIRVEPLYGPTVTIGGREWESGYTREHHVSDALGKLSGAGYDFRDHPDGGVDATVIPGLALPGEPPFRYEADELPQGFKEPEPAGEQYHAVEVFRLTDEGFDAYRAVARVDWTGRDYPPDSGLIMTVPSDDDSPDGYENAVRDARRIADRMGGGRFLATQTLPFNPLLLRLGSFVVRSVARDWDGWRETEWLHSVLNYRHADDGAVVLTNVSCEVVVADEQRISAPALVLPSLPTSVLDPTLWLREYGVSGDDLYFGAAPWLWADGDDLVFDDSGPVAVEGDDLVVTDG